jgi:flagellar basal-body rod protein FlgC
MAMFNAIGTAGTGLQTYHTWLDAIANNIANMNDTAPSNGQVFREEFVQIGTIGGGPDGTGEGVAVTGIKDGPNGQLVSDPSNPIADSQGYVRRADVNLNEQMGDMIMAQRAFQANASVIDQAKEAYQAALAIGKNT